MAIAEALLQELDHEAQATTRVLERVPDAHLDWRPHAKSYSLGQLALHVAQIPGGVATLAMQSPAVAPQFVQARAERSADLVPALRGSIETAKKALANASDATMLETWRLVDGDRQLLAMPRAAFLRAIMLNHWYHHRGQLLVYLRQLDVPLPSVYGPTADENPFA
ncbi:MAG TPA: DinB family protein [Vicinamibacterales bacterium]|nr:DinB family protein [Vicinamibacterales bacterium]